MTNATTPTPDIPLTPAVPDAQQTATQQLLDHVKTAEKTELEAIKPLIGKIVRAFVSQYEQKLTGVTGMIERRVIDSIMDAIFGPAQQ